MNYELRPALEIRPRKSKPLPSCYDNMHRYKRAPRPFPMVPMVPAVLIVLGLCVAARVVL